MDFDHSLGLIQNVNSADGLITIGGTGAIQVPTGTTAQRPASAGTGAIRINSTSGRLEVFNNSAWTNIGLGDVSSVALSLPSIFSVVGSPITTAGTLAATLNSQAGKTVLAAPFAAAGTPTFRQLSLNDLSDVLISSPATANLLAYDGTRWGASPVVSGSASGTLATWTSIGGSPARFTASFAHNLGTFAVVVNLYDTVTNKMVLPDSIQLTNTNTVLVTLSSGSRSLRIVVIANGQAITSGGSAPSSIVVQNSGSPLAGTYTALNFTGPNITTVNSGSNVATITIPAAVANAGNSPSLQQDILANRPVASTVGRLFLATDTNVLFRDTGSSWTALTNNAIRTLSYVAASLDTPNNSDWIINGIAPAIPDPSFNSMTVRSFDAVTEVGVGLLITPPVNAVACTFSFKGRAQTAPGATAVVQPRVYRRQFGNNTGPGAWSSAFELANISIPTNANFIYSSQTVSLASLGWVAGQMTLLEITRRVTGVAGGTNLASAYLLAELTLEFN